MSTGHANSKRRSQLGEGYILVGEPPPRCKGKTLIMLGRKYRSKWWHVACFGQKSHYRSDGSCVHTDALLDQLNPEVVPADRCKVEPFGSKAHRADLFGKAPR